MVEVNAETDFVARNETFQDFVATVARDRAAVGDDLDAINAAPFPGAGRTVAEQLTHLVATIGENMTIRRAKVLTVKQGVVATYVHQRAEARPRQDRRARRHRRPRRTRHAGNPRPSGRHARRRRRPEALDVDAVDPAALERESAVLTDQARQSGKPDNIIEKMVEGRIRKYYEEVVLLEQVWVHDGESRVRAVVKKAGVTLTGFVRFQLGEGIEKPKDDFAAEVAATAGV